MKRQLLRLARLAQRSSIICSLLLASTSEAQVLLNDGGSHTINAVSQDVEVRDGPAAAPTTLTVATGAMISASASGRGVGLFEHSIMQMTGGSMTGDLSINGNAVATLTDGTIGDDVLTPASGNGQLIMNGGKADDMIFDGTSRLEMNNGMITDDVTIRGSAMAELNGGMIGDELFIEESAHADVAGGTMGDEVFITGNSTATFTGGTIVDDLNPGNNAVVTVNALTLQDGVDTSGNSITHLNGGLFQGSITAIDSSKINITGGNFPNIFSGGAAISASGPGAMVTVTGGTFGEAGEEDDAPGIVASQGGVISYSGATVAGLGNGTAPAVRMSAALNGVVNLHSGAFDDLILAAQGSAILNVLGGTSDAMEVTAIAAIVNISGGASGLLDLTAQNSSVVNITGGDFGAVDIAVESQSVVNIFGRSFLVNGVPLAQLSTDAYRPDTGELRIVAGSISGILRDDSPFSADYSRQFTPLPGARVFLHVVPEPGAAAGLMIFAALAFSAGRRQVTRKIQLFAPGWQFAGSGRIS